MAIGAWNEDELREAIRREMRDSDLDRLVRQLQGGLRGARVIWGGVNGTTGAVLIGSGFTAARTGVGLYTVTFTTAFAGAPAVAAIAVAWAVALQGAPTTTAFSTNVFNTTTGAAIDRDFYFLAAGI